MEQEHGLATTVSRQQKTSVQVLDVFLETNSDNREFYEHVGFFTEFENSTIILTATRIGTAGNNYIWTSEGRNSPTLNLKPNSNYEFIINTLLGDQ